MRRPRARRSSPFAVPSTLALVAAIAVLAAAAAFPARRAVAEDAVGPTAPAPAPAGKPEETAAKRPFLWVVEGAPRIYLFGTIHVPDPRVLALTPSTKAAFDDSDVVVGELTPAELQSPDVLKAIMAPEGKKLADLIPKDVKERLDKYLADNQKPAAIVEKMNPMGALILLVQLEMLDLMIQHPPMDLQFHTDAAKAQKESAGLETAKEQIAALTSPPADVQARLLDRTVKQLAEMHAAGQKPLEPMIAAYLKGDLDALAAEMAKLDPADEAEMKALMKRLLGDRNAIMVDRMLERASAAPTKTYFVFVGAGHYAGADGILALLEKKGKKVRRLGADEKLPARASDAVPAGK